jgi:hypothetical protein
LGMVTLAGRPPNYASSRPQAWAGTLSVVSVDEGALLMKCLVAR